MKIIENHIYDFNGEWQLGKYSPKIDGYYMTIRCGFGGIYTCINEWKDGMWQVGVLDDSDVIAYSKEQITKEQVKEWANEKLKNYKKK